MNSFIVLSCSIPPLRDVGQFHFIHRDSPYGLYWRFLEWICLDLLVYIPTDTNRSSCTAPKSTRDTPFLAVEIKGLIRIRVVPGESRHRRTVGKSSRDIFSGGGETGGNTFCGRGK